jgi:hypothetical protein
MLNTILCLTHYYNAMALHRSLTAGAGQVEAGIRNAVATFLTGALPRPERTFLPAAHGRA